MKKSFRIAVFVTHPIQYYSPWFRHLSNLLKVDVYYAHRQDGAGQARSGFGVSFEWDTPILEGYRYHWLQNTAPHPGLHSFWGCDTPQVYGLLNKEKYDAAVVFGWNKKSYLQAIHACHLSGTPVMVRGDSQKLPTRPWFIQAIKKLSYPFLLSHIDAHLYVGVRNKEYLQYYGVPEHKLFPVPHFVDNDFFETHSRQARLSGIDKLREKEHLPPDAFVLIFAGKMIPKKRPFDLVRASIELLKEGYSNLHVVFVGDGPLRGSLEKATEAYRDHFHFCGFVNQNLLPSVYALANVLVLPSDGRETWGLVVNEAMACGLPAIVSNNAGCVPDLIDEKLTGFSYPVGHIHELKERVVRIAALIRRKPEEVKEALKAKIQNYSIQAASRGLLLALEQLTDHNTKQ